MFAATPALAQRTEENAAIQSEDAFGKAVGNERSGLYSAFEVRGFSPSEAGNVRLQGLYFDLPELISARLIDGYTVRVGLAAQRYPFPAPTGLVDYRLEIPQGKREISVELDSGGTQIIGPGGNVNFKLPLAGEKLGIAGGAAFREATRNEGGTHHFRTYAALAAFRPAPDAEFLLFTGKIYTLSDEARATYFPAGNSPPPQVPRGVFHGLAWTERNVEQTASGAIAKFALGGGLRVEAGLFRTVRSTDAYADLLLGVDGEGRFARRVAVVSRGDTDTSISGEARLIGEWKSGALSHTLTASLRGRAKNRRFGGSKRLTLTSVSGQQSGLVTDTPDKWPEPAVTLDPKNQDRVRQLAGGVYYSLYWPGKLSIDAGLSKQWYTKTIDFADPAAIDTVSRDRPILWNIDASVALTKRLIAFGGMTRGQEDALIAPDIAVNRAEAPPAIRTRQFEAGLRYAITPHLGLVTSYFSIEKPYYNLDTALRYRQLGVLHNRGVEFSLTGQLAPGLSLVGGMLLLDPHITGEPDFDDKQAVGQVRRRIAANLDWRLGGGKGPLSFDLYVESVSSRMANAANTFRAPPNTFIDFGARYRFSLGSTKFVFRPQIHNLFNSYGWRVSPSGGFTFTQRRYVAVSLLADF